MHNTCRLSNGQNHIETLFGVVSVNQLLGFHLLQIMRWLRLRWNMKWIMKGINFIFAIFFAQNKDVFKKTILYQNSFWVEHTHAQIKQSCWSKDKHNGGNTVAYLFVWNIFAQKRASLTQNRQDKRNMFLFASCIEVELEVETHRERQKKRRNCGKQKKLWCVLCVFVSLLSFLTASPRVSVCYVYVLCTSLNCCFLVPYEFTHFLNSENCVSTCRHTTQQTIPVEHNSVNIATLAQNCIEFQVIANANKCDLFVKFDESVQDAWCKHTASAIIRTASRALFIECGYATMLVLCVWVCHIDNRFQLAQRKMQEGKLTEKCDFDAHIERPVLLNNIKLWCCWILVCLFIVFTRLKYLQDFR